MSYYCIPCGKLFQTDYHRGKSHLTCNTCGQTNIVENAMGHWHRSNFL